MRLFGDPFFGRFGLAGAEAVVGRHRERRQAISLVRVVSSA